MGTRKYRGPVQTVGQAIFADLPVQVVCQTCLHWKQMHAYQLVQLIGQRADGRSLRLFEAIPDLMWCRKCRMRTTVKIVAPLRWAL